MEWCVSCVDLVLVAMILSKNCVGPSENLKMWLEDIGSDAHYKGIKHTDYWWKTFIS